jgi:FkbM family methyltransferase
MIGEMARRLLHTLQVNLPHLQDTKFALYRLYRNKLGIPFEKDFHALSLFPDFDEALFLDIGANRGFSADAILMKTNNSRIELFEPNPLLWEKLMRLYGDNKRITIHSFGIGDKTAESILYIPYYKKWMFDELASFDKVKAKEWLRLNGRILFYKERYLSLRELKCKIKQLDELELQPFFIKLDIQGYEFQALKGGKQTISAYEPILLVESPDKQTINFLESLSYQMYAFNLGKFVHGVRGQLNTFFMTESKSSWVEEHIMSAR